MSSTNERTGPMARPAAFTIIEVLVTAVVLSLLSYLGLQSFYRTMDSASLSGAARDLYHAAGYARLLATETRRPCRLWLDTLANRYWVEPEAAGASADLETGRMLPGDNPFRQPHSLPAGVRFESIRINQPPSLQAGLHSIPFYSDSTTASALIRLNSEQDYCTLLLWPCTARADLINQRVDTLPFDQIDLTAGGQSSRTVFVP